MKAPQIFEQMQRVTGLAPREVRLNRLQPLFRRGDVPIGLLLLVKGRIDLFRWSSEGRAIRIHSARAGELFAEASLYSKLVHCDAIASEKSTVRVLALNEVRQALASNPVLSTAFTRHLVGSLMQARQLLELRSITPLAERTYQRLEETADDGGWLPAATSLSSIAIDLGVTPAAFYRSLAQLEAEGRISRPARGKVKISKNPGTPFAVDNSE